MTGDRTTLNIATDEHRATREVKDEYGESWTDVLRFYREHRDDVSVSNVNGEIEHKLDQIQSAQANTVEAALEAAEDTGEVLKVLDRLEAMTQEATDAAQRAEKKVEDLQP